MSAEHDLARQVIADSMEAHLRGCTDHFQAACAQVLRHGGGIHVTWAGQVTWTRDAPTGTVVWDDPPEEDT